MAEEREGSLGWRLLPDGRDLTVYPLTFGRARLVIGQAGSPFVDDGDPSQEYINP